MKYESSAAGVREKRLERALNHVQDYWFPVNSQLLKHIQNNLKEGVYRSERSQLVNEVCSDFSLFAYCLRELVKMINRSEEELSLELSPLELIEQASLQSLQAILDVPEQRISKHQISDGSNSQIERFKEMLISSSTSEVLAESFQLSQDQAFSASVLRQLGMTLVAWNYPGVYQEALSLTDQELNLDQAIANELGFSPQLLAARMLISWGFEEQRVLEMGIIAPEFEDDEFIPAIGATLAELCEIGEALARANYPETYPSARDDWSQAQKTIESRLGSEGMNLIRQRLYENCELYVNFAPEIVSGGLILDPEHRFNFEPSKDLAQRNPYYSSASPALRKALESIYQTIDSEAKTELVLRSFVEQAIPFSEFSGGCVFTVDPTLMMMMPQLVLGPMHLRQRKPVDYSVVASGSDLVSVAYQSSEPVIEYGKGSGESLVTGIAGIIGRSRRIGVLYLEIPEHVPIEPRAQAIVDFKAISFTLSDCLRGF